jgi:hypothetical protein
MISIRHIFASQKSNLGHGLAANQLIPATDQQSHPYGAKRDGIPTSGPQLISTLKKPPLCM